jgi:YfiH family protein
MRRVLQNGSGAFFKTAYYTGGRMNHDGLAFHGDPPAYLTYRTLTERGVPHATTTRHCPGVSSPAEPTAPFNGAASAVLARAGVDASRVAYARQVHGADVVLPAASGYAGHGDVLATREHGLALAIFTADCLAVTLHDSGAPALVVAHVGWRGTVAGATASAVAALERIGGRARDAVATISPSIGPCCYEVDAPVVAEFDAASLGPRDRWLTRVAPDRWMLDLWSANEDLLDAAGVERSRIDNPRLCTACNPGLLYSYRKRVLGRLATVAALP